MDTNWMQACSWKAPLKFQCDQGSCKLDPTQLLEERGKLTSKIGNEINNKNVWATVFLGGILLKFNYPNIECLDIYTLLRQQTETGSSESDSFHLP